ncbi:MAG: translation initiation factor IF-2 N-terminal domain-containing protein, partial [Firmicutes bacterium]|nr:translation initiation factor IF-2 N-terminal domain-containing protein [Bacillota bacterium]
MKIHELAKELNITSKELLEKAGSLGIEAKAAQSNVSDADADKLRNSFGAKKAEGGNETKIVKVTPKKNEPTEQEPKVVVKAAKIAMPGTAQTSASGKKLPIGRPVSYEQNKATKAAAPIGKPVAYQENKAKPAIPVGKPVAYKSNEEREKEAAAAQAAAEAAKKAAEEKAAAEAAKKAAEEKEKASHRSPLD